MEMLTTSQPSSSSFYADVVVRRAEITIPTLINRLSEETTQPIPMYMPNAGDMPRFPLDHMYRLRLSTTPAYLNSYGLYEECFYEDWFLPNLSIHGSSPHDPRLARPGQAYIRFFPFRSTHLPYPVIKSIPLDSPFYDQPLYVPQDYPVQSPTLSCIPLPNIPEYPIKEDLRNNAYGQDTQVPLVHDTPFQLNSSLLNDTSSLSLTCALGPVVQKINNHDHASTKNEVMDSPLHQEDLYKGYIQDLATRVTESLGYEGYNHPDFETVSNSSRSIGNDEYNDETDSSIPSLVPITPPSSPSSEFGQPSHNMDV
ncbi:hypothetical protein EUX98_g8301 [Antrodiella citrinella]|uniref:Uncharacterized protein n=1 Tax=Antrodiella citrinella TaxID=2447956 RepID=A0A4S4M960_9APHY|nr:hypothetical protein EUX98_g8301 [Antrodiella citrinella]